MGEERLQKLIARAGVASRRRAEELIVAGRVRVNGRIVDRLGAQADAERDRVEVDGRRLQFAPPATYVLYKPRGVVTTLSDPEGRRTVLDIMRAVRRRIFPIGRLDYNTAGALLLTADGELANGLLHPRRHVPRVYRLKVKGRVPNDVLQAWARGVEVDGRTTKPAQVYRLAENADNTWLSLTIYEGRNRQVHRMCEAVGLRVMRLTRVAFAGISIEGMRPGDYRQLDRREIAVLRQYARRPEPRTRIAPPPGGGEPVAEEARGEEDDGTWKAWNEGAVWELFDGESRDRLVEAPVAGGVVRRSSAGGATDGTRAAWPPPDESCRSELRGRLRGRFEDDDWAEPRTPQRVGPDEDRGPQKREQRGRRPHAFGAGRPRRGDRGHGRGQGSGGRGKR